LFTVGIRKLYKAPPKRELAEDDRITVNMGGTLAPTEAPGGIAGTGIGASFVQLSTKRGAPPPPPDAVEAYSKKSEQSTGVIQMIKLLIKDLDEEMTRAEVEEKSAQEDYDTLMTDAAAKRTTDSKLVEEKDGELAAAKATIEDLTDVKRSAGKELGAALQYISSLHSDCDWLVKYNDVRKQARMAEIDALSKAKAVLSGADYSLLQTQATRHHFLST